MNYIRHKDLNIPKDDPFKSDKLNRKPYALVLTDIIAKYSEGFVLAINNEWGSGKTTFVKMWRKYLELEENNFKTIYFNAWDNDFESDVLVALLSELKELERPGNKELFKEVAKRAAPLTKKIIPSLFKGLIERYTDEEFSKAFKDIVEGAVDVGATSLANEMRAYSRRKEGIISFRNSLKEFVKKVVGDKPLVFIVDELDRCRPSYAVEALEQVKHLFSVPGIVFVLSIDKVQLGHAVRGVYGSDRINAEEYLRRFIDLEYVIPSPWAKDFSGYLFEYYQLDAFFRLPERQKHRPFMMNLSLFQEASAKMFEKGVVNLREQEKILSHFAITMASFDTNQYVLPHVVFILIYLKYHKENEYVMMRTKRYTVQDLLNSIESIFPKNLTPKEKRVFYSIEAYLLSMYNNYLDRNHAVRLFKKDEDDKDTLALNSKFDETEDNSELMHFFGYFKKDWDLEGTSIGYLLQRVDLIESFKEIK